MPKTDLKAATESAVKYLTNIYPEAEFARLEEVELSDDDKYWVLTLSYQAQEAPSQSFITLGTKRFFKSFKIDAATGEVRSMKIRELH